MNSNKIGNISQQAVILELMKFGAYVYTNVGDGAKVDFLFTFNYKKIYRVQVKTVWIDPKRKGTFLINARGTTVRNQKIIRYSYDDAVDFIAAYSSAFEKCYIVPIEEVGKSNVRLRFLPPKFNQSNINHLNI